MPEGSSPCVEEETIWLQASQWAKVVTDVHKGVEKGSRGRMRSEARATENPDVL